jgi:hypothetical protein
MPSNGFTRFVDAKARLKLKLPSRIRLSGTFLFEIHFNGAGMAGYLKLSFTQKYSPALLCTALHCHASVSLSCTLNPALRRTT